MNKIAEQFQISGQFAKLSMTTTGTPGNSFSKFMNPWRRYPTSTEIWPNYLRPLKTTTKDAVFVQYCVKLYISYTELTSCPVCNSKEEPTTPVWRSIATSSTSQGATAPQLIVILQAGTTRLEGSIVAWRQTVVVSEERQSTVSTVENLRSKRLFVFLSDTRRSIHSSLLILHNCLLIRVCCICVFTGWYI